MSASSPVITCERLSFVDSCTLSRVLRIADSEGNVRATQEDLGRLAGMSRAAFRRAFADLIAGGVVEMEYAGLRILDPAALQAEADRR